MRRHEYLAAATKKTTRESGVFQIFGYGRAGEISVRVHSKLKNDIDYRMVELVLYSTVWFETRFLLVFPFWFYVLYDTKFN
jgi:hypothetical protein